MVRLAVLEEKTASISPRVQSAVCHAQPAPQLGLRTTAAMARARRTRGGCTRLTPRKGAGCCSLVTGPTPEQGWIRGDEASSGCRLRATVLLLRLASVGLRTTAVMVRGPPYQRRRSRARGHADTGTPCWGNNRTGCHDPPLERRLHEARDVQTQVPLSGSTTRCCDPAAEGTSAGQHGRSKQRRRGPYWRRRTRLQDVYRRVVN
jgi:hypothetical protein